MFLSYSQLFINLCIDLFNKLMYRFLYRVILLNLMFIFGSVTECLVLTVINYISLLCEDFYNNMERKMTVDGRINKRGNKREMRLSSTST